MRIGLLAPPWLPVPPPAYGGTEMAVDVLARGLTALGHDVVLFTCDESSTPVERRSDRPAAPRSEMGNGAVELRHLLAGRAALADCDVIHDHTLLGPFCHRSDESTPIVATVHGPFDDTATSLYRTLEGSTPLIAISHHHASTAPFEVAAVIHHGIDVDATPLGDGLGGYTAFLGRMDAEKGVHLAARAALQSGVPLRIAAKMSTEGERAYFEHAVRPLLGGCVEYLGELGQTDKATLLSGAAALVNPIQWDEPFGMVMIEALAHGTPVLASPRGSVPEIVIHGVNGSLCRGVDQLATGMLEVGQIDRSACRDDARRRFSMQRMATSHVALYSSLIAARRGSTERRPSTVDLRRYATPAR